MNIDRIRLAIECLIDTVERSDTQAGVCYCGDSMDSHSHPMHAGHSPTDAGDYAAHNDIRAARDVLSELHKLRPSVPENEIHKRIKPFLTRRQQGYVMGVLRELDVTHNPRSAKPTVPQPRPRIPA